MMHGGGGGPSRGHDPGWYLFGLVALICAMIYVSCLSIELRTTELAVGLPMARGESPLIPNYWLLAQPFQLFLGWLPASHVGPIIIGWVLEILVQGGALTMEVAAMHIQRYNKRLAKAFAIICIAAFFIDAFTNWKANMVVGDQTTQILWIFGLAAGVIVCPWLSLVFFRIAKEFA